MWDDHIHAKLPAAVVNADVTQLVFAGNDRFDVFASVFWMLSRYEEYIALKHDKHGRFMAASSVLGWDQDTQRPWADIWRKDFANMLQMRFPDIRFKAIRSGLHMTVDVDSAFAYRHKGLIRTAGAMAKDVLKGNFANLLRRLKCVLLGSHDPYDTYDVIATSCDKNKIPLTWFFLLADRTKEDIGLHYRNKHLRSRIRALASRYETGIHPGYASNDNEALLKEEKRRLEEITGKSTAISRQHYLKLSFPETYQRLLHSGIRHDYTMGFAESVGFRAGTNYSYPWFDLKTNQRTALIIHPFIAMDTTLRDYLRLTPDEAIEHCKRIMANCRDTGGECIFLWHNESLSETGKWRGWSKVFFAVLNFTQPDDIQRKNVV
jgi:hypothetical protein